MKILGWLLILTGVAGDLYFTFGFTTSVTADHGPVINLDLQQDRLFGFLFPR